MAGAKDVVVVTPGGTATLAGGYTFTVNGAASVRFAKQPPKCTVSDRTFAGDVVVEVLDKDGQVLPGAKGGVALAVARNDGSSTYVFQGNSSNTAAPNAAVQNGAATFAGLGIHARSSIDPTETVNALKADYLVAPSPPFFNFQATSTDVRIVQAAGACPDDATLSSLTLSAGTLSPAFAAGTLAYTATSRSATASITVTPTLSSPQAKVTVNGVAVTSATASQPIALRSGQNAITVRVTAEDGTTIRDYVVSVTRPAARLAFTKKPTAAVAGVEFTPQLEVSFLEASDDTVVATSNNIVLNVGCSNANGRACTGADGNTVAAPLVCDGSGLEVPAQAGVATFSGCRFATPSTVRVSAIGVHESSGTIFAEFRIQVACPAGTVASSGGGACLESGNVLRFSQQPTASVVEGEPNLRAAVQVINVETNTPVTNVTGTVTLAITSYPTAGTGTGTLSCEAANLVNGAAAFSGCKLSAPGTYYLAAESSVAKAVVSNVVTVEKKLAVTGLTLTDSQGAIALTPAFSSSVTSYNASRWPDATTGTERVTAAVTTDGTISGIKVRINDTLACEDDKKSCSFSAARPAAGAAFTLSVDVYDALNVRTTYTVNVPAASSGLAGVNFSVTPATAGSSASMTVEFTQLGAAMPSGSVITVGYTDFVVPGVVTVTSATGFSAGATFTAAATSGTVAITVTGTLAAGTKASLSFPVTNPAAKTVAKAGLTVRTSQVTTAVASASDIVITAPALVCQNGGTLANGVCVCLSGYVGRTCESRAPARLEFSAAPSFETSGVNFASMPVVKAVDSEGNTVTTAIGSVALTLRKVDGTTAAVLAGTDSTTQALSSGTAAFSNLKVTGVDTGLYLVATYGSMVAQSPTFCVYADAAAAATASARGSTCAGQAVAATAAKLAFVTSPAGAVKDTAFQPNRRW